MNARGREEILHDIEVLRSSTDRDRLARSAVALAASGDQEAIGALGACLEREEFLRRLDDVGDPQRKTYNLRRVFVALQENPAPATGALAVALAEKPDFTAEISRLNYLLPALAAVRPMTEEAADVFRRTNREGFYHVNAPLLVGNGEPAALAVFEEMIEDRSVDPENRADALHVAVLPRRTELPVLDTCARLLQKGIEPETEVGVIETVFDYQQRRWFGPVRVAPEPPPWNSASSEALRLVLEMAARARGKADLPSELQQAIDRTVAEVTEILAGRAA